MRRSVIGGKVMRAPDLERLDARQAKWDASLDPLPVVTAVFDGDKAFRAGLYLDKDAPRTWPQDKALLVALGVDGDVPFEQAAKNADLPVIDFAGSRGKVTMRRAARFAPANDNHEIAAKAA